MVCELLASFSRNVWYATCWHHSHLHNVLILFVWLIHLLCGCQCSIHTLSLFLVHDMEGSTTRTGSAGWEEEWVMCSCKLCKWQKRRRRRIALEHIKRHGEFDRQLFEEARRHGTVILEVDAQYRCMYAWDGVSCN